MQTRYVEPNAVDLKEELGELVEILARGCLRLILSEGGKKSYNRLKGLDKPAIARDELDK